MALLSRRSLMASAPLLMGGAVLARAQPEAPDYTLTIAATTLEFSPKHRLRTVAYNGQAPGPLLRLREGRPVSILVHNRTDSPEIVHWHGLQLPSEQDGAMEEGAPMIAPGGSLLYRFTPRPAGFRWYHTHTFAGGDFGRGQYTGQHGFLLVEPAAGDPGGFDAEFFLNLHDWRGQPLPSDDGAMNPVYDISTVNGRMLGAGEPLRVRTGQRVRFQILNSSPSEVHWLALAGHRFRVIALDGNPVPTPRSVPMLRLAPAERVTAEVAMDRPGVWILGEVRRHIQAAGMGIVVEYANAPAGTPPAWEQPLSLEWDQGGFSDRPARASGQQVEEIPLVLSSRFNGHGAMESWCINGKSYPQTDSPILRTGGRYRLLFRNRSTDDHPMHLHRHSFELSAPFAAGIVKDTLLVPAGQEAAVEFVANNPGPTLLHCHQQNHMDLGFMMVFRYV